MRKRGYFLRKKGYAYVRERRGMFEKEGYIKIMLEKRGVCVGERGGVCEKEGVCV